MTLRLSGEHIHVPVYWLAAGPVRIVRVVDLSGERGHDGGCNLTTDRSCWTSRSLSVPGPGGFAGGFGGNSSMPAIPGLGPLGGGISTRGTTVSNRFAVPLQGGSGGGGNNVSHPGVGSGGGAGGGALLIASSESITFSSGQIQAHGGFGAGHGAGGMIRLVAPMIGGTGTLDVSSGDQNLAARLAGTIRLEAFRDELIGTFRGTSFFRDTPFDVHLPDTNIVPQPSLRVVRIGGIDVPADPRGSFDAADVVIDDNTAVTFEIEATNIPDGTLVTLLISSEEGGLQQPSATLEGNFAASAATVEATLPRGFTQFYVEANWTP